MQTQEIDKTESKVIDRKDFMKQVGLGFGAIMLMNCLQSCGESEIPDPMLNPGNGDKVDFTLNLDATGNTALNQNGGFLVIKSEGVIAARKLDGSFVAVSSACTHQGTTIDLYRKETDDFVCPNHGSVFSSTGAVKEDPATTALKKFNTSYTATSNTLRIFE